MIATDDHGAPVARPVPAPTTNGRPNAALASNGLASGHDVERPAVDQPRIERAVREILAAIGEDPDRDGLLDTPSRVARAYTEIFGGLHESPAKHLARVFEQSFDELITVTDIDFHSMCEHHLLPFSGRAHVAYLPNHGRVVGLSKLARTVRVFARRPQIQERLTQQIADAITEHLDARGVVVLVEAEHLCMSMRGVCTHESMMTTVVRSGLFREDREEGERALAHLRSARRRD